MRIFEIFRRIRPRPLVLSTASWLLVAVPAFAEPSVSLGHIPVLWGAVAAGAVGAGATPFLVRRYAYPDLPLWAAWLMALVAFIAVAGFFGPIFIVIMSILITGRTM